MKAFLAALVFYVAAAIGTGYLLERVVAGDSSATTVYSTSSARPGEESTPEARGWNW